VAGLLAAAGPERNLNGSECLVEWIVFDEARGKVVFNPSDVRAAVEGRRIGRGGRRAGPSRFV